MKSCCLLLALFLFTVPAFAAGDAPVYHQVRVELTSNEVGPSLQLMGFEIQNVNTEAGWLEIFVRDDELSKLDGSGIPYRILIEDVASYYEYKMQADPLLQSRAWPDGSMGGNYTYSELEAILDGYAVFYPDLITPKFSIGKTIENRDIWCVKISDNPNDDENEPECYFDGLIHAREPQSMMTLLYYMKSLLEQYGTDPELTYLVDNREIYFVLVHNPDGYCYNEQTNPNGGGMWRKNRRNNGGSYGVDLNRNYGYKWGYDNYGSSPTPSDETYRGTSGFSEPETQAVRDFVNAHPISVSWNTHTYGNYYLCPFGYASVHPPGQDWTIFQEYLADTAAVNGYTAGSIYDVLYAANGGAVDWHYGDNGNFSITPEIGSTGFWPSKSEIIPLAEENQMPIKYWTWVAGSYVFLQDHVVSDQNGDGNFHPGESGDIVLTLRNKGLGDTLTNAVATITSSSSYVTIIDGTHDFGTLAGYTEADNSADPMTVKLSSWTPYGEAVVLDVNIDFDGYTLTLPITITCGVPTVFFEDDMETNQGWSVQNTSISTGAWERADPAGTDAQPENDHSATGTMCYVTGRLGGSIGNDDVDGGPTRLTSPVFDLSSGDAEVSYYVWFYHSTSGGMQPLTVEITNNGVTWTKVEDMTHSPSWNYRSFNVSTYVTPSNAVQVRFSASDNPNDSIVEALIDDFEVKTFTPQIDLELSAPAKLGTTVNISIDAPTDGGLGYFMAASTITYPVIPIGQRKFPLGYDFLIAPLSITPGNGVFNNFIGTLDGAGHSSAPEFKIPWMPVLLGKDIFVAAATIDGSYPNNIKNISAPLGMTIE
jgi:hypothetical protein